MEDQLQPEPQLLQEEQKVELVATPTKKPRKNKKVIWDKEVMRSFLCDLKIFDHNRNKDGPKQELRTFNFGVDQFQESIKYPPWLKCSYVDEVDRRLVSITCSPRKHLVVVLQRNNLN